MKKLLLLACVVGLGLGSCNKKMQCPAYGAAPDASRASSTIVAQAPATATERQ